MLKIYIPYFQFYDFIKVFNLLFEYLDISHYIILHNLVDGDHLVKSTYGNLDFMKEYNPLTNLIWNNTDKKWRNYTLFTRQFEPIYPDLFYEDKKIQEEN